MNLTWNIDVPSSPAGDAQWPAQVSVPLPHGSRADHFSIVGPDGKVAPAQHRTIVSYSDGSPRWVQLDFQASSSGAHTVSTDTSDAQPVQPVIAQSTGSGAIVEVGRCRVTIADAGIASMTWNGQLVTDDANPWTFVVTDLQGHDYTLKPTADSDLTIEADGPLRFSASWHAAHVGSDGKPLLDARLRLDMYAGIEGFRLSYQFIHKLPGCQTMELSAITAHFPLPSLAARTGRAVVLQNSHSRLGTHRYVRAAHRVPINLDRTMFVPTVEDAREVLDDQETYPHFLKGLERHVGAAIALENQDAAVVCHMRDTVCQRPKTIDVEPGAFTFGIWPQAAGTLKLPQGRSSRQQFSFRFLPADPGGVDRLITAPTRCDIEPVTAWLDRTDAVHAGASWDQPRAIEATDPGAAYFSSVLEAATRRWHTVAEMFHYGDSPDIGYTATYAGHARMPEGTERPMTFSPARMAHGLFENPTQLPQVWTNNEYDIIYCFALEAMRTRNSAVFEKMRAAARHQIEVDFVHYNDDWQQHRGTPAHSYDHTAGTAIIASHQWTQGLYHYYCLTGDDDVPEVVRAICDYNIAFIENDELAFSLYFNRELGWALVALVFGYELSGEKRYIEFAERIIRVLQQQASRTDFTEVEMKTKGTTSLNATGLGTSFNVNTIPLGVKAYHQATGEAWAKDLLIEWIDFAMTNHNNLATGMKLTELLPETFCYVSELTGDDRYLRESTWQLRMFFRGFGSLGWTDAYGKPLDTKQYTRIYRGLSHQLAAMSRCGLLEPFAKELLG